MTIGLLMPSILMAERFADRIFAPKDLFLVLADGLVDRGHTVFVYSTGNTKTTAHLVPGDPILEQKELSSVKIRQGEGGALISRINAVEYEADVARMAYAHAKEHGVDLMHMYMDSLGLFVAEGSGIPTVLTIHDPLFSSDTVEGWRARRFAKLPHVAISRRQQEMYGPEFTFTDVVYHGVDVTSFPYGDKRDGYLAFVGRLIAEKGIEDALEVSQKTTLPLHIATSENYLSTDYYKERLAPRIASSSATMTGYLQKKERDTFLSGARALVFPIHWEEPFGMVLVEAMACGTPVIAYNRGSVSEIVKDGVTGFVVHEKEGVAGLVRAVKRVGEIDRDACRKHVEKKFTIEKMIEGYENVYKNLLAKK